MIEAFILFILTFLIGYYLGGKGKEITEEIIENAKKSPKRIFSKEELKVGPIKRPSAQVLNEAKKSDKEKDGLKAMEDTLKDIPELN